MRFHVQGAARGWQDYLVVDDSQQGATRLTALVDALRSSDYFSVHNDHQAYVSLTQLDSLQDEMLHTLIERQKVRLLYLLNEHELAEQVAQRSMETVSDPLQRGLLLLEKAQNLMFLNRWTEVGQEITESDQLFASLGLTHLQAAAALEQAWAHFANQTFRQGIEVLNGAATKARVSNEPLLEVTAHMRLAFLASKANLPELMHAQTNLAKELIDLHQLAEEHRVLLHYNQAWAEGMEEQALPHYQRILDMDYTSQYSLYFYSAARIVAEITLNKKTGLKHLPVYVRGSGYRFNV